jgi:DNA-binding NarL/FixJ family response regulator
MYRLLIIDRRPLFAEGIRHIARDAGLPIGELVRSRPGQDTPIPPGKAFDAAVVTINAPDDAATASMHRLAHLAGGPPVLAVCAPCESVHGLRLLRLGARSVIGIRASPQEIAAALTRTLKGGRHVSAALADHLLAHFLTRDAPTAMRLRDAVACEAQLRLIQLLALGQPMSAICDTLGLSPADAHAQRQDILRRTGLADEHELTRRAFEQQLVPDRRGAPRAAVVAASPNDPSPPCRRGRPPFAGPAAAGA